MFDDESGEDAEDWYDIMQVCTQGHQITAYLKSQPESGRKFCEECGASTIFACPACNQPVLGYRHIAGVLSTRGVPVPKRCGSCGAAYPWTVPPEARTFSQLLSSFDACIRTDCPFSLYSLCKDAYAALGEGAIASPLDLCNVLDQFYWVIAKELQRDGELTGARLAAHIKNFKVFLRQFETGLKAIQSLLSYDRSRTDGNKKQYERLCQKYNEWVKDFEAFLAAVRDPNQFLRLPALSDIPLKTLTTTGAQSYGPGDAYKFLKDVRTLLTSASKEVFVVEPYPNEEIFELYLDKVAPGVNMKLLYKTPKDQFATVGKKFILKPGIKLEVRQSSSIHDRHLFVDGRCWIVGKSLKDAAVKDPTYVAEVEDIGVDARKEYDSIWITATVRVF